MGHVVYTNHTFSNITLYLCANGQGMQHSGECVYHQTWQREIWQRKAAGARDVEVEGGWRDECATERQNERGVATREWARGVEREKEGWRATESDECASHSSQSKWEGESPVPAACAALASTRALPCF